MGLAVSVGVLAYLLVHDLDGASGLRKELADLNRVLERRGLAPHCEPEVLPELSSQARASLPYNYLHHLRRAYCCLLQDESLRSGELSRADEDFIFETSCLHPDSHLLNHSDSEGFYIPEPLPDGPLCDDALVGGFVGSSQGLRRELLSVSERLGIRLEGEDLAEGMVDELTLLEPETLQYQALTAWFTLYEAARLSLEHKSLICFS